jgi:hypothetical protein
MGALALGVLLATYVSESASEAVFDRPEEKPVAWVDGKEVPLERFNWLLEERLQRLRLSDESVPDGVALHLKADLTEQLIDERCLELAGRKAGIEVSDKDVDGAFSHLEKRWGDAEAFARFVDTYPGGLEELRFRLRFQVMRERLLEKTREPLSDEHLEQFYKQNPGRFDVPEHFYAQEFLLRVGPDDPPEHRDAQYARAKELAAMAHKEGASFSQLAMRYSEGPTARVGGDLGRVTQQGTDSRIWKMLAQLTPGDVSPVVETKQGFHVLKLLEQRPAYQPSFEKVRESIHAELEETLQRARRADFEGELRARHDIFNALAARYSKELSVITQPIGPSESLLWSMDPSAPLPDPTTPGSTATADQRSSSRYP